MRFIYGLISYRFFLSQVYVIMNISKLVHDLEHRFNWDGPLNTKRRWTSFFFIFFLSNFFSFFCFACFLIILFFLTYWKLLVVASWYRTCCLSFSSIQHSSDNFDLLKSHLIYNFYFSTFFKRINQPIRN